MLALAFTNIRLKMHFCKLTKSISSHLVSVLQELDHTPIKEDSNHEDGDSLDNGDDGNRGTTFILGCHAGQLVQVILAKHDKYDFTDIFNDVSCQ